MSSGRIFKYLFLITALLFAAVNLFPAETAFLREVIPSIVFDPVTVFATAIPVVDFYTETNLGYGRVASHHPNLYIESKAAENEILFGRAVQYGTTRDQGKTVSGASGDFAGAAMYSVSASLLSEGKYSDKDALGICRSGFITVYVEEAVNAGDAVRVRHTNHASIAAKTAGNFCKTADAGKTYLLEGAKYEKTVTGAGETVVFLSGNFKVTADA